MNSFPWILLIMAAFLNGAGSLLLKYSQSSPTNFGLRTYLSAPFLLGATLFGITLLVVTRAFRDLPIIVAYPSFVVSTQIVVGVGAAVLLGEHLNLTQVLGIAIAVLGVSILIVSGGAS